MKSGWIRHEAGERLARSLAQDGPGTASELAGRLGVTPAGVRRTLQGLLAEGFVTAAERAPYGPAPATRRGRPSHVYSLTDAGRTALGAAHDQLAHEVLRFVAEREGNEGLRAFAQQWAWQRLSPAMDTGPATAELVAEALTAAGYSASVEPVGTGDVQICMHHCPIVDIASEFPAMCEAETEAISQALGRHVTRLATLANGDGVCTTIVPQRDADITHQRKVKA
ncbi:MAG: helix-turn-helix transcriptional regulator [Actinomycetales bacterium]